MEITDLWCDFDDFMMWKTYRCDTQYICNGRYIVIKSINYNKKYTSVVMRMMAVTKCKKIAGVIINAFKSRI